MATIPLTVGTRKIEIAVQSVLEPSKEMQSEAEFIIKTILISGTQDGGAAQCIKCPFGSISESKSDSCKYCPAGFETNKDQTECITCKQGFYNPFQGGKCIKCPNHTYSQTNLGSTIGYTNCKLYDEVVLNES